MEGVDITSTSFFLNPPLFVCSDDSTPGITPFRTNSSILSPVVTTSTKLMEEHANNLSMYGGLSVPMKAPVISFSVNGGRTCAANALHRLAYPLNVSESFLNILSKSDRVGAISALCRY